MWPSPPKLKEKKVVAAAMMLNEQEEDEAVVIIEDDSDEEEEGDEESRQCKPLAISMVDDDDDLSHEEYHDDEGFHDEYHDDDDDVDRRRRSKKNKRTSNRSSPSRMSLSAKKTVGIVTGLVEQDQQKCCKYYRLCAPSQRKCWLRFICLVVVPLTILPLAFVWLSQPGNDLHSLLSIFEGGNHQDDGSSAEPGSSSSSSSSLVQTTDLVMTKTQLSQIKNYQTYNALMVNLHIGFHGGGSTFCYEIGKAVNDADFSCTHELDTSGHVIYHPSDPSPQGHYPWTHKETDPNIQQLVHEKNVHMVSWSLQKPPLTGEDDSLIMLKDTDWENPHLVSVLLVQDPMVRIVTEALTHSRLDPKGRPLLAPGNSNEWWSYAKGHSSYKDNLALRIYSDGRGGHSDGTEQENQQYLEEAQELIKRFTFVLDAACIDESMDKLAEVLSIRLPEHNVDQGDDATTADDDDDNTYNDDGGHHRKTSGHVSTHEHSMRAEIGDDKIYDYLAAANKWDIKLYEWSKGLALVQCITHE